MSVCIDMWLTLNAVADGDVAALCFFLLLDASIAVLNVKCQLRFGEFDENA